MLSKGITRCNLLKGVAVRNFSISPRSAMPGDGSADNYERVRNDPRTIKYTGQNVNVASHNVERRPNYKEEFTFWTTFNMGVEGFSHCHFS